MNIFNMVIRTDKLQIIPVREAAGPGQSDSTAGVNGNHSEGNQRPGFQVHRKQNSKGP